jgi:hypothetical protein
MQAPAETIVQFHVAAKKESADVLRAFSGWVPRLCRQAGILNQ